MKYMNKDIPDGEIIKWLCKDNLKLLNEIKQLKEVISKQSKEYVDLCKKLKHSEKIYNNYKKQTKVFYDGITKEEGFKEIIKELKNSRKQELISLRKQRDDLMYICGKYARLLQENCLL